MVGTEVDEAHGRHADWPSEIPRHGWWDILRRVFDDVSRTNISLVAAGLAFFAFLAIPAALTALVALYGLVFDPAAVGKQIDEMQGLIPTEAVSIVTSILTSITLSSNSKLGAAFLVSLLLALWSIRSGTASLMSAVNVAYEESEKRGFIRFNIHALVLTAAATLFTVLSLALVAVLPAVIDFFPLGSYGKSVASIVRWPVLAALVMLSLSAVYRFAPSRQLAKWRWVSWGAAAATVLWLIGSILFSLYVSKIAAYDRTYGSLGAVVALLMWLYLTCFVILVGAELNAEIEHQTARDSTTGAPRPMGKRGATMADTLGEFR
jgi:membrane protein